MSRRLIWIPIIHTQADMGNMMESVKNLYVRSRGENQWARHVAMLNEMWREIRKEIEELKLPYERVRLYQDGLANCGHEMDIVRDLARAGSENYQLLLHLTEKGAKIVGTESPELLLEEYELARHLLVAARRVQRRRLAPREELRKIILEKRDRHIAERINATLDRGETGLLFLGLLHAPEAYFPADVQVTRLSAHLEPADGMRGSPRQQPRN